MAILDKISSNSKRLLIDKANATMLMTVAITSFVVIFSLIAVKALFSQSGYQGRVIKAKTAALKQLKENNKNVTNLVSSYESFASEPVNVLDGNPGGNGPKDGDNPKIVLDALPSKYDFPGLISSLEKLLKDGGFKIESIGGNDDELAQQNKAADKPTAVSIPFPLAVTTNFDGAQNLLKTLENSIRPMYVDQISVQASNGSLRLSLNAHTFYLPEKTVKITTKVIK